MLFVGGGVAVESLYINKGISLDLMSTRNISGYIFVVQEVVKYDLFICLQIGSSHELICWCDDHHPDPRSQRLRRVVKPVL